MPNRRRFLSVAAACAATLPLAAARATAAPAPIVTWRGTALGAACSLTLVHHDRSRARAAVEDCVAEMARLESIFSLYQADSALSRLNAAGELGAPPQELVELLSFALALAAASGGAFDPTVQPLYRLYARRAAGRGAHAPSAAEIARVLERVDYRALELDAGRIRLRRPGMALTLNGVAQGYITDRLAERLRAAGFDDVLVDVGEARALGGRGDGEPWRAVVPDPRTPAQTLLALRLGAGAIPALATSAGSGTPFGADSLAHHLLDPHTGASANHYLSVSVAAPRALLADALSTALYVLPPQRLPALLAHYPAARAWVLDRAGRLSSYLA